MPCPRYPKEGARRTGVAVWCAILFPSLTNGDSERSIPAKERSKGVLVQMETAYITALNEGTTICI